MKIFIPELKTELRLTQSWTFTLVHEYRNKRIWEIVKGHVAGCHYYDGKCGDFNTSSSPDTVSVTFPADTVFSIDRIYIRQGARTFSSVTMVLKSTSDPRFLSGKKSIKCENVRFWASLIDFNTMDADIVKSTVVSPTARATCGQLFSLSDLKRRVNQVGGARTWVKGTVGGQRVNKILELKYSEGCNIRGYPFSPTSLRLIVNYDFYNPMVIIEGTTLAVALPAANISGIDSRGTQYDLTFYKVNDP